MKNLNQVQKYLNKIPNINEGGCGISALTLYRWIKENAEIGNTKFVFLYREDSEDRYFNNQKVLKDSEGEADAPSHACLLYEGKFIDSDGDLDISNFEWVQIIDEEDFVKRSLENVEDWNYHFDRGYIREIELEVNISLEDIK